MLNSEQTQAVEHSRGPVLVVSGPGSGKTRVITERIANLINNRSVPPWKILAITFTNKAAKEMKERVDILLGSPGQAVMGGTFHATCARILRQAGSVVGEPNDFVIYDTDDSESVVKSVMKELNTPEQFTPRQIRNRISSFKTSGHLTESVSSISGNSFLDEISIKVLREYDRRLRQSGAVDFDDLLNKTHLLLTEYRSDAATFLNRFEHVLVDEFQDTNRVQYEIAKSLAGKSRNFFIVGDEDQSIYSWRAADVQNFQRFKDDFPEADVIYLGQNYRSTGNIIRAAETIINKSSGRSEKALWTENTDGDAVRIMVTGNSEEEAWFVANQIEDKLSGALS
ncbi:MAG: UvrD-helicase domain-containing protein, partial [Dehalococcoidia bacterium]|nr:UvrD-helicase domain-containing protein [Dehalococcoidia bacterium]